MQPVSLRAAQSSRRSEAAAVANLEVLQGAQLRQQRALVACLGSANQAGEHLVVACLEATAPAQANRVSSAMAAAS